MNRPTPEELIREHGHPEWSELRQARVKARIDAELAEGKPEPRARPWLVLGGGLITVAAAAALVLWVGETPEPSPSPGIQVVERQRLELPDGSWVRSDEAETRFQLARAEDDLTEVRLETGRVEVQVQPNPSRLFRIRAGEITVEVLGTRFIVERAQAEVRVEVREGRVRVTSPNELRVVGAGEQVVLTPTSPEAESGPEASGAEEDEAAVESPKPSRSGPGPRGAARPARKPGWKRMAEAGDWQGASRRLSKETKLRTVEDKMLAADALRLAGEPARALRVLRKVVEDHPRDPRAPLALFTQARLLLDELGRPRDAAMLFARLQEDYGESSLAEDALAREVEAWSRYGQTERARARARQYLARYPDGHRVQAVKRFGGLDP